MAVEDKIKWIGHCYEGPSEKPKHDKIWGYLVKDGKATVFWGRRTAQLTFKLMSQTEAEDIAYKKRYPGMGKDPYVAITFDRLKEMDWEFEDRFHEKMCLVMLGNFYHRAGESYAQK